MQFREAAKEKDDAALLKVMSNYGMHCPKRSGFQLSCIYNISKKWPNAGEEVVTALGSEVDRLEKEIQYLVPGIRHVDIEAHNPTDLFPWLDWYFAWYAVPLVHSFSYGEPIIANHLRVLTWSAFSSPLFPFFFF